MIAAATAFYVAMGKPAEHQTVAPAPVIQTPLSNTAGLAVQKYGEAQLRQFLVDRGFRNLSGVPLHTMRRMYLLWHYAPLFEAVHEKTGLPKDVLFAYFIIEATRNGAESNLMAGAWNPGGVKHKGISEAVFAHDDCYDADGNSVPCAFEAPMGFEQAAELWAGVFNAERYDGCKGLDTEGTCECLYKSGYHTAPNYQQRVRIAGQYAIFVENHLPNA